MSKQRKTIKLLFTSLVLEVSALIAFILNETKDEVNADLSNVEQKLDKYFNEK